MGPSHEEAHIGVARVAIRLVWTATIRNPEAAFADTQIVWGQAASAEVPDENTAAERLAV